MKQRAKPFIDVTVDRFSKGIGALIVLVLINKTWGFHFTWQQLSWASLCVTGLWIFAAMRARREYRAVFRKSLDHQQVQPESLRLNEADLTTIETLVEEQGHQNPRHVIYAIDMLESLGKPQLITPLLLSHDSPDVRARALGTVERATPEIQERWLPGVERLMRDTSPVGPCGRRARAGRDARRAGRADDAAAPHRSRSRHGRHGGDGARGQLTGVRRRERHRRDGTHRQRPRASMAPGRREVAQALGALTQPEFRRLLVPLMYDQNRDVALEAIRSAGRLPGEDYLFVPQLVSLLRNRLLKAAARNVLVGYGPGVVPTLAYFLRDQDEDVWVRRHIPSTLARIPGQQTMDVLVGCAEREGRLPPLQGDQRHRPDAPAGSGADAARREDPRAARPGGQAVLHVSELPLQPRARRQGGREHAAGARAARESGAHGRSDLPAARA